MRTRFPFRYGIASLSVLPHLFVHAEIKLDGERHQGVASDGLPPKWFDKNPASSVEQDLAAMIAVIQNAARLSPLIAGKPAGFFDFWRQLHAELGRWCAHHGHPPLLAQFGVSLVERAVLDALCRAHQEPLHWLLRQPLLGIDFGAIDPALAAFPATDVMAHRPLHEVAVRHTIGLGDFIRAADIPAQERLDDGLPQALDEAITAYGLRYFKIKLSGRHETDLARLRAITSVLGELCEDHFQVTLDGNENYADIHTFRDAFQNLQRDEALNLLFRNVLWVEQPLHRQSALDEAVKTQLAAWPEAPALIIDESDASLDAVPRALHLGYRGVSHKNCKGIMKGLLNAAYLHAHRQHAASALILSGEDLANVGPVALHQDLAMQAILGISHVERNGHHYFRGLSVHHPEIGEATLNAHPDLYTRRPGGLVSLNIHEGRLCLDSVNRAPFGCAVAISPDQHPTLKEWILQGGFSEVT